MNNAAHYTNIPSLGDTIGAFCQDVLRLRRQLQDARAEIRALKDALSVKQRTERIHRPKLSPTSLRKLRRQLTFVCHPDRGGDAMLMKNVNWLFDELEGLR